MQEITKDVLSEIQFLSELESISLVRVGPSSSLVLVLVERSFSSTGEENGRSLGGGGQHICILYMYIILYMYVQQHYAGSRCPVLLQRCAVCLRDLFAGHEPDASDLSHQTVLGVELTRGEDRRLRGVANVMCLLWTKPLTNGCGSKIGTEQGTPVNGNKD